MRPYRVGEALAGRLGGDARRFQQRRLAWIVARVAGKRLVVDIGASDGTLALEMAAAGAEVQAVEWDLGAIELMKGALSAVPPTSAGRVTLVNLDDVEFADVELIVVEALDRLDEPDAVLDRLVERCAPGTSLLISAALPLGLHGEPWLSAARSRSLAGRPRALGLQSETVFVSAAGGSLWLSAWEISVEPNDDFSEAIVRGLVASGEEAVRTAELSAAVATELRKSVASAKSRDDSQSARLAASDALARNLRMSLQASEGAVTAFSRVVDRVSGRPATPPPASGAPEAPRRGDLDWRPSGGETVVVHGPVSRSLFPDLSWVSVGLAGDVDPEAVPYDVTILDEGLTLDPALEGSRVGSRSLIARLGPDRALIELKSDHQKFYQPVGPSIDPRRANPIGFATDDNGLFVIAGPPNPGRIGWNEFNQHVTRMARDHAIEILDESGLLLPIPDGVKRRSGNQDGSVRLSDYRGVLDHRAMHASPRHRVTALADLAARGIPVVALDDISDVERALGEDLSRLIHATTIEGLGDRSFREHMSVSLRRIAHRTLTVDARWREIREYLGLRPVGSPTVSVVAATNRPGYLDHLVAQIARQTYPDVEPLIVLHGDNFSQELVAKAQRTLGREAVVMVPESYAFGDALNLGVERASGSFVTKMDDDDWYTDQHIRDLVSALRYSAADLVGKAAEFVYLQDLDLTIRRIRTGSEAVSETIAGGTMLMRRDDLQAVGGWRPVARSVDRALMAAVTTAGGTIYRTHGFGYLLNRHGVSHTWDADADYFLRQSQEQVRGLALGFAGIEES